MTRGSDGPRFPNRRSMLFGGSAMVTAAALIPGARAQGANQPANRTSTGQCGKPNILVIFGDDIGQSNISAYTFGRWDIGRRTSTGLRVKE